MAIFSVSLDHLPSDQCDHNQEVMIIAPRPTIGAQFVIIHYPGTVRDHDDTVKSPTWICIMLDLAKVKSITDTASRAFLIFFTFVFGIPVIIGLILSINPAVTIEFAISVILFQALAVFAGLGLQLDPLVILAILNSVALGAILFIFEICNSFAENSRRVRKWISKMEQYTCRSDHFTRFGELMLIPLIWVPGIGLYGCAVIAWIFRWIRPTHIVLMMAGWNLACSAVMLTALGLINLVFVP
jgi:uncharacterized membrane protein